MYIERHSIKIQIDMQVFFFKIGVNIQMLTRLVCLLNTNNRPSQGEYLASGLLLSEASSQIGKGKLLLTHSSADSACILLKLLKDLTFVTYVFCKNPSEHELHLTSMVSTQNSPSCVQQSRDDTSLSGQMAPVHKYTYYIYIQRSREE